MISIYSHKVISLTFGLRILIFKSRTNCILFFRWYEQRDYMNMSWGCGTFLATVFVFINLVGQLGGVVMVIGRLRVPIACGMLFFIVILQVRSYNLHSTSDNVNIYNLRIPHSFQTIAYSILWDLQFLLRNLALIGALLLVLAESRNEARSLFAGVPSLGDNKPKSFMQLAGRILLAFMFITLIRFELSFMQILQDIVGSILMVLVVGKYFIQTTNNLR